MQHLLVEQWCERTRLTWCQPDPIGWATSPFPQLILEVVLELVRHRELVNYGGPGLLETLEDGGVQLQGHPVPPQGEVGAGVQFHGVAQGLESGKIVT